MQTISYQELKDIQVRSAATIVNVLPAEYFEKTHIPGAINIPYDGPDFADRVKTVLGGRELPVVVYCANSQCDKSRKAGHALVEAGFSNVMCYEGGAKEWQEKSSRSVA